MSWTVDRKMVNITLGSNVMYSSIHLLLEEGHVLVQHRCARRNFCRWVPRRINAWSGRISNTSVKWNINTLYVGTIHISRRQFLQVTVPLICMTIRLWFIQLIEVKGRMKRLDDVRCMWSWVYRCMWNGMLSMVDSDSRIRLRRCEG